MLDVSETGARLKLCEELLVGQEVELSLLGQGHLRPLKVQATVVWCRPSGENSFEAGFCFAKRLNYRDMQFLT